MVTQMYSNSFSLKYPNTLDLPILCHTFRQCLLPNTQLLLRSASFPFKLNTYSMIHSINSQFLNLSISRYHELHNRTTAHLSILNNHNDLQHYEFACPYNKMHLFQIIRDQFPNFNFRKFKSILSQRLRLYRLQKN
eukprot:NODE_544_length_6231_cov_0.089693.p4 type:complete len:136 gc:universal NODE_544_length_6231_cov_0.089693:955-548(-)